MTAPLLGFAPLHLGFDGKRNGYTTPIPDSQVVLCNSDMAKRSCPSDQVDLIIKDTNVMYLQATTTPRWWHS